MHEQKSGKEQPNNFVWFLGKMMRLPLTAFAFSLEMFVKTFNEIQRVADDGVELFTGGRETGQIQDRQPKIGNFVSQPTVKEQRDAPTTEQAMTDKNIANASSEHNRQVTDRDLRDDLLKLVRYKVLFVKREYEHAFAQQEVLIAENLDAAAFTVWKAAEFIQRLAKGKTEVPEKWRARNYPPPEYRAGSILKGLPAEDKKYLRVFYQVVERFPREKFKFEEQQIEVLEQIRDRLNSVAESDEKNTADE